MTFEVQSFIGKKVDNDDLFEIIKDSCPACSGSFNEKEYQIVSTLKKSSHFQSFCSHQVISKFNRGETIAKMLYDSPKNGKSRTVVKTDLSRFNCELDHLHHRSSIDVSSASFLFPERQKKLFRDIGFILDEQECTLRSAYTEDVFTRILDIHGRECEWNESEHGFVVNKKLLSADEYGEKTEANGDFKATNAYDKNTLDLSKNWKDRLISIAESRVNQSHNEIVIRYDKSSILGVLISNHRYRQNNITHEDMKQDALLVQDAYFDNTGDRLPIYLLESVSGELSLFVNT